MVRGLSQTIYFSSCQISKKLIMVKSYSYGKMLGKGYIYGEKI